MIVALAIGALCCVGAVVNLTNGAANAAKDLPTTAPASSDVLTSAQESYLAQVVPLVPGRTYRTLLDDAANTCADIRDTAAGRLAPQTLVSRVTARYAVKTVGQATTIVQAIEQSGVCA
jgi:hypothetical protein